MALTYGFYDSLNHDRVYSANQMSTLFNGIITDGVFANIGGHFSTVAGTGMQVVVKTGRAWFDGTWTSLDADYPLTVDSANNLLARIDAVVLETNFNAETRANSIKIVKGTPASSPTRPALINTPTVKQHVLAYINLPANTTAITNSMIEIQVGVDGVTNYITSVLQSTSIRDLYLKWENEWNEWFADVKSTLTDDVAANLLRQIEEVDEKVSTVTDLHVWDSVAVTNYVPGSNSIQTVGDISDRYSLSASSVLCIAASKYSYADFIYTAKIQPTGLVWYPGTTKPIQVAASINSTTTRRTFSDEVLISLNHENDDSYFDGIYDLWATEGKYLGIPNGTQTMSYWFNSLQSFTSQNYTIATWVQKSSISNVGYSVSYLTKNLASAANGANYLYIVSPGNNLPFFKIATSDATTNIIRNVYTSFDPNAYIEGSTRGNGSIVIGSIQDYTIAKLVGSLTDPNTYISNTLIITTGKSVAVTSDGVPYITDVTSSTPITTEYLPAYLVGVNANEYVSLALNSVIDMSTNYRMTSNSVFQVTNTTFGNLYLYCDINGIRFIDNTSLALVSGIPASPIATTITKRGKLGYFDAVETGSYYGTGTFGAEYPCMISLSHRPRYIMMTSMHVIDDDRAGGMPLLPQGKMIIDLKDCPNEYQAGFGFSVYDMGGNMGRYDDVNNVYYWYGIDDFDQCNAGSYSVMSADDTTDETGIAPMDYNPDDVIKYVAQYFWVAFG